MSSPFPRFTRRGPTSLILLGAAVASLGGVAMASTTNSEDLEDLSELSLEELLNIEVTIATRSEVSLSEVPGAVYVITGDELRRSGHTSVQEAMRMVPGMYVSNWTTSKWDVTSRGFGTGTSVTSLAFLNQLMVLIDGVPVSTPVFAGTWWALQDIDLNDVDRIEIVRGPGGILWGANAVHGVIHVITKESSSTQGLQGHVTASTDERHQSFRMGGEFGETGTFRVNGKWSSYDTHQNPYLGFGQDWGIRSGGFRFDWGAEGDRQSTAWGRFYEATIQADGFDLTTFEFIPVTDVAHGFQFHYATANAEGDEFITAWVSQDVQDLKTELDIDVLTLDLEYRREIETGENSNLSTGIGYRHTDAELLGDDPFWETFDPASKELHTLRAFAVHTWDLMDHDLSVVLGAQAEDNSLTGFELQPTLRASWHPQNSFSAWGAITGSVRTPSLEETNLASGSVIVGNPDFDSEKVTSFEVGVRHQVNETTALDLAVFHNEYDDLQTVEFDPVAFEDVFQNGGEGSSDGIELAMDSKPTENWSLRSSYSYMLGTYETKVGGVDLGTDSYHPRHQINVRSYYDISETIELDAGLYVVDGFGDDYTDANRARLDVRLGWEAAPGMDLFVGAQQLGVSSQTEFDSFDIPRGEIYFGVTIASY